MFFLATYCQICFRKHIWHKRLEEERFQWPFHLEGPVITLTEEQFAWLLERLDLRHLRPHRTLDYRTVL